MTPHPPRLRWPYVALAYASLALGGVGIVLPGLPTTPFVLLSAWAASRGSERLERWLYEHPRFGAILRDWRDERAVPRRAKVAAVILIVASWAILAGGGTAPLVLAALGIFFILLVGFLLTRPEPSRRQDHGDER